MAGSFIWSTTFTDIFSQWTENRAVWNIRLNRRLREVKDLEKGLPFELLGFDVDKRFGVPDLPPLALLAGPAPADAP